MNNLLEEEEEDDEMKSEKIDDVSVKKANGTHLSSEAEDTHNSTFVAKDSQQNLIINCVNGLKTETCI